MLLSNRVKLIWKEYSDKNRKINIFFFQNIVFQWYINYIKKKNSKMLQKGTCIKEYMYQIKTIITL